MRFESGMDVTKIPRRAEWALFGLLAAWLAAAVVLVDIEYYDGLDSVLNARFYTGQWQTYEATRGPLMGFLLVPAEWARMRLGLDPLDTRPHHAVTALLHFGYLLGSYALLCRLFGRRPLTLLAWVAAVPNFLFFSYAPFVSHDILPGLFFLAVLAGADAYMRHPRPRLLAALGVAGAAAMSIKHTHALCWICALAVQFCFLWGDRSAPRGELLRRWLRLSLAAAGGVAVMWLALCASLGTLFPETPFLLRAGVQLKYLLFVAHDRSHPEHAWVYLRNFPAYGMLAMLLVLPGAWLCWRGTRAQRNLAAGWVIAAVVMHLLNLRQVRYLSFLAPVTAALILPVLGSMLTHRWGRRVVAGFLVWSLVPLHAYCVLDEMAMIARPFHRESEIRALLAHLRQPDGSPRRPVAINFDKLSFLPPRDTPFAGDIYHDLYHLGRHHLRAFCGLDRPGDLVELSAEQMQSLQDWNEEAAFALATAGVLINPSDWERGPPPGKQEIQQMVFHPGRVDLRQAEAGLFVLADGSAVASSTEEFAGTRGLVLRHPDLARATEECIVFQARVPGRAQPFPVLRAEDGTLRVPGLTPELCGPPGAEFAVRIRMIRRVHHHHNAPDARAAAAQAGKT